MSDFASPVPRRSSVDSKPLGVAALLIVAGALYLAQTVSGRQAALYAVGGGSTRMIVTLAAFIVGSVVATANMPFWTALPSLQPISLVKTLGAGPALALNWIVFAAIAALTVVIEKRRHGRLVAAHTQPPHASPWLHGPWPLMAGAIALALLNFVTLALSGRPSGITSAFALWGAKASSIAGFDVASWPYWASKANAAALAAPVLRDVTSVMDIGIVLGAMLAAALAGPYAPVSRPPVRSFVAASAGGPPPGPCAPLAYRWHTRPSLPRNRAVSPR